MGGGPGVRGGGIFVCEGGGGWGGTRCGSSFSLSSVTHLIDT